jgi:D-serine deaminase-like pyridoxal phosphate-dependent protein
MQIDDLETPMLLVDKTVLEANIQRMADYCNQHEIDLRVHVKSHKSPMIAYKQIAAGACGIVCQKLSEAEVFADTGFRNILIPYNIVGAEKLNRLIWLAEWVSVSVTVDSLSVAEGISRAAKSAGHHVPIFIEIDTGGQRCGTQTPQASVALGRRIVDLPHVELAGVMTFPTPPRCRPYLSETLDLFEKAGIPIPIVSGGGTPHAFQTHDIPEITELRVGTYVFYDLSHVYWGVCEQLDCALTVLTTVVSTPTPDRVILDAGAKTLTGNHRTQPNPPHNRVYGITKDSCDAVLSYLSEEHGHLNTANVPRQFQIGEKVQVIPTDSWATVSINDTFALVRGAQVLEILPILARGQTK